MQTTGYSPPSSPPTTGTETSSSTFASLTTSSDQSSSRIFGNPQRIATITRNKEGRPRASSLQQTRGRLHDDASDDGGSHATGSERQRSPGRDPAELASPQAAYPQVPAAYRQGVCVCRKSLVRRKWRTMVHSECLWPLCRDCLTFAKLLNRMCDLPFSMSHWVTSRALPLARRPPRWSLNRYGVI